ncbi:PepSY domain-containing protein [Streptomyces sp. NBC_00887]|uniref:PepSY domain-containing protein n=1 Tax=Streptomyces sp. NBC_00887 TaxID=2975859 RepID=UPI0038643690|nr:PepSY domain-containing protein [Streptomyces sp. NBC_00887]
MQRNIAVIAVAAAVLIGGGAAAAAAFTDDGSSGDSSRQDSAPVAVRGDSVTVDDAVAAALKAVPGRVIEAELEDDDGNGQVWELDVYGSDKVWHDVKVDADNAKVLSDRGDADNRRPVPGSDRVSVIAAVDAARGAEPGTVTSVDLDGDDGALVWDVDIAGKDGRNHELDVDARTADVSGSKDDGDNDD